MHNNSIEIIRAEGCIADQARALIDAVYADRFGICLGMPEHLLIARSQGSILGTFGITTSRHVHGLRLPRPYSFDRTAFPFAMEEERYVEFGRWTSRSRLVSAHLMHHAAAYSLSLGKEYAWCEQTYAVHRASRLLGIQFALISKTVCASLVERSYAPYYENQQPSLYVCKLIQVKVATAGYVEAYGSRTP